MLYILYMKCNPPLLQNQCSVLTYIVSDNVGKPEISYCKGQMQGLGIQNLLAQVKHNRRIYITIEVDSSELNVFD